MKRYTVISGPITIFSGILEMDERQASARSYAVTPLGEGLFEVVSPVQFKNGEEFGYDGDVNKSLLQQLTPAGDKKRDK